MNAHSLGTLSSGTVLKVWLPERNVFHFGILDREWFGSVVVIHNSKDRGTVASTSVEEFAKGHPIEVFWTPQFGQGHIVVARAKTLIGKKPFDLLMWNCEHFVTWVLEGVPRSPQLDAVKLGLAAVALLLTVVIVGTGRAMRG